MSVERAAAVHEAPSNTAALVLNAAWGIDILGDVHGQAAALIAGLEALGFEELSGTWRHPAGRKALFLGDLIDRGPESRGVLRMVRATVLAGESVCIIGNHELNAVDFARKHPEPGRGYLSERTEKNLFQHIAFLHEYRGPGGREALAEDIEFMSGLPFMIELDGLRAVHACSDQESIDQFSPHNISGLQRDDGFWYGTAQHGDPLHGAAEFLLKGPEQELPDGRFFEDKDGHCRTSARIKWWADSPDPWDRVIGPPALAEAVRDLDEFDTSRFADARDERPVFLGHYWIWNEEGRQSFTRQPNVQCLDFSVGSGAGQLRIYRWDGEEALTADKLISVSADGMQFFTC